MSARTRGASAPSFSMLLLLGALAAPFLVILLAGRDPLAAAGALARGAFGGRYAVATVLTKACPLILTGLSVSLAFRTGFWNIGAEGQLICGAIAGTAAGLALPRLAGPFLLPVAFIAAAAAGGALALAAALLRVKRGALEVITTILLNFVAIHFLSYCVNGPLQESAHAQPVSDLVPEAMRLARIAGNAYPVHAGLFVALALAVGVHVLLFRTALGLELRAVGLAPEAARHARVPVASRVVIAASLSGGIAGLAGAIEIAGVLGRLYPTISPGYGYTGIAVALLGGSHPLGVIPAALFFGALEAGSTRLEQEAGVSSVLVRVIQAATIIASALFAMHRATAAAANRAGRDAPRGSSAPSPERAS